MRGCLAVAEYAGSSDNALGALCCLRDCRIGIVEVAVDRTLSRVVCDPGQYLQDSGNVLASMQSVEEQRLGVPSSPRKESAGENANTLIG
jgi:hypothetical protein